MSENWVKWFTVKNGYKPYVVIKRYRPKGAQLVWFHVFESISYHKKTAVGLKRSLINNWDKCSLF